MEVRAVAKFIRVQPRKVRIIADQIRGVDVHKASGLLRYHTSKGAKVLYKVLASAVANAAENHNLAPENLRIATIMVDDGPKLKRITARSMGRANRIEKKMSHVTVVVEEFEPALAIKPHGTKAKPRPQFAAPKKGKKPFAAAPIADDAVEAEATATEEVTAEEVMAGAEAPVEEVVEAAEAEVEAPAEEATEAPAEAEAKEEEKGA